MLIHWIWYAMLPGVSVRQKLALLEHLSDPEDLYDPGIGPVSPAFPALQADSLPLSHWELGSV